LINALLQPVASKTSSSVPTLPELAPMEGVALVNGQVEPMVISANQSRDGFSATGDGFGMNFAAVSRRGAPINLDNDGNILLDGDRNVTFGGFGFAPGSLVQVWLFSDPVALRQVVADKNGEFTGESTIPGNIPFGQHTVQLNGITNEGVIRTLSMGVKLTEPAVPVTPAQSQIEGLSFNWIYAVIIFPLAFVLWFVLARRRSERKTA